MSQHNNNYESHDLKYKTTQFDFCNQSAVQLPFKKDVHMETERHKWKLIFSVDLPYLMGPYVLHRGRWHRWLHGRQCIFSHNYFLRISCPLSTSIRVLGLFVWMWILVKVKKCGYHMHWKARCDRYSLLSVAHFLCEDQMDCPHINNKCWAQVLMCTLSWFLPLELVHGMYSSRHG